MRKMAVFVAFLAAVFALQMLAGLDSGLNASPSGRFDASGRQGTTCGSCHSGASGASIQYSFAPVDPTHPPFSEGYVPGASYDVTVTVTGGPAVQWGFAWDADGGTGTVTDPTHTKLNTDSNFPSNFTHTSAGNDQNSWMFQWNAPITGGTVTFWGAGASTNGSGTGGDAPTTSVSIQADPAPSITCRAGNVNAGIGPTADVLYANGSVGAPTDRKVTFSQTDPFTVSMVEPPAIPGGPAKFVLYFFLGSPTASTVRTLPIGLGTFCMPIFLTDANPQGLKKLTNNIGKPNQLGVSDFPSQPAPTTVLQKPSGIGVSLTAYMQGLIIDPGSPQGQAAVTNGIVLEVTP